jgi:radial spoke head protein 4/6
MHIAQHILPQGRTKWWNPIENADQEEEEDNGEDDDDMKDATLLYPPESGPALLTLISSDMNIQNTKPWTAKISSHLIPQFACGFVRSNLWPGAYAFARGAIWENIYIGFGHKYAAIDYGPVLPSKPADEYTDTADIIEADDPTAEDEAKAREAEEHVDEEGNEDETDRNNSGEED